MTALLFPLRFRNSNPRVPVREYVFYRNFLKQRVLRITRLNEYTMGKREIRKWNKNVNECICARGISIGLGKAKNSGKTNLKN